MSLTIDEIREAALIGKLFTLTDVKLIDMSYANGKLSFGWEMPQMQNKPYCPGMVVDYISICEKPKYDPCRLFKKGDIVRLKDWNGRCPAMYSGTNSWFNHPQRCKKGNLEVRGDEKSSKVEIGIIGVNCAYAYVAPCYLELITPIEELKPYSVEERTEFSGDEQYSVIHIYYNYNGGRDKVRTFYENGPESWNATKAAAEAECDRLNAEWKKDKGALKND